jgi:hypothetical protein
MVSADHEFFQLPDFFGIKIAVSALSSGVRTSQVAEHGRIGYTALLRDQQGFDNNAAEIL